MSKNNLEKKVLSNGIEIPVIGYGTGISLSYKYWNYNAIKILKYWIWNYLYNKKQYNQDKNLPKIIKIADKIGCNLFDTSRAYAGSEEVLGKNIKKEDRSKFFLTTKISNADQLTGDIEAAFDLSLKVLNTDYIDLCLMHWPQTDTFKNTWKQMEAIYKKGKCRAIGVCNFKEHHFEELDEIAEIQPMVNQIECHPLFTQESLIKYCNERNIQIMAYTPTGRMDERLFKTKLPDIARKYSKDVAQIILRWHIQLGNIPIINTTSIKHFKSNFNVFDFELTPEEIRIISDININSRLRYDADNCDFTKL